jgi:hypothetical protein
LSDATGAYELLNGAGLRIDLLAGDRLLGEKALIPGQISTRDAELSRIARQCARARLPVGRAADR